MGEIADEIAAVVAARRVRLPELREEIARWRRADAALAALQCAIARLAGRPATPPELSAQLGRLPIDATRLSITRAIALVQRLQTRVARASVCIGVGGPARTGKSTVLQAISGLTDAQLPTGPDAPVTAVLTRIHHTAGRRRALLSLHTFDTFRATHLQPRYARAGLGEPPTDVDAFRTAEFPEPDQTSSGGPFSELRAMQQALWSYEALLDRPDGVLELIGDDLDRLPEYVAYPRPDEAAAGRPAHRYLAVRDARIECPFPRTEHGALTLVDLPGLSIGPRETHRQHLSRLRYDVDVMLLVGRAPTADQDVEHAILAAFAPMRSRPGEDNDAVLFVRNTDPRPGPGVESLRGGPAVAPVLEVNGREPADVSARLLRPVLRHLAERLPALDEKLCVSTRMVTRPVRDDLVGLATDTKAVLGQLPAMAPGTAEELYRRADDLHVRLGGALRGLLADMLARSPREQARFRATVVGTHAELVRWARDGLGEGRERWYADARRGMIRDGVGPFAAAQWTRVRVAISNQYAALDRHLQRRLTQVWADVAATFDRELGGLLSGRSGAAALAHLAGLARTASEPCPALGAAIEAILTIRLDYRSHLHPLVWSEVDQPTAARPAALARAEHAEQLFRALCAKAERASARSRDRLLGEAARPEEVLCAAVARLIDTALAPTTADREIRQLVRAYPRQLWADAFPELDAADARVAWVDRAADDVLAAAALVEPAP